MPLLPADAAPHPAPPRGSILMAILTLCLIISSPALAVQTADDDYSLARGLYKSRKYKQAADAFDAFLEQHPKHARAPVARLYYGLTLSNLNRYEAARQQFETFIRENPENRNLPDALYRVGECSYYLREYKDAEKQLRDFRTRYPEHPLVNWAFLFEGDSQLALENWADAERTFRLLLDRKPEAQTQRDAQYGLARAYEGQQKIREAFDLYRTLLAADDPVVSPRALARMGSVYFNANDLDSAVRAYTRIDEKYPDSPLAAAARLNAGLALYKLGQYDKAIEWVDRAAKDTVNRPRADILHALCLQKLKRYGEADALLKSQAEDFATHDAAPEILYYRADGLRVSGKPADAIELFEKVAADWPQSEFADDALFFAADAALQAQQPQQAVELLDRLNREFPGHTYKDSEELLRGRILAESESEEKLRQAITHFRAAADAAKTPRTRTLSQYYLARVRQQLREHEEAVQAAKPVVDEVLAGEHADLAGIVVLAAVSQLALDRPQEAARLATEYLDRFPSGSRRIDAFEVRAIAAAKQSQRQVADADLKSLQDSGPTPERLANAIRRVAEVAWEKRAFDWSEELFGRLVDDPASDVRPAGLSGLAWSRFEQDKFAPAAEAFGKLFEDYPDHKLAPESIFMKAESLRRADRPEEALAAYLTAYEKYLPASPAPAGAEFAAPTRFAFDAGRQAARLLERAGRIDEADKLYRRLADAFPNAGKLDEVLERWAFMHLDAENFERSDAVFRELIEKRPNSPLVANARLALAESDMVAKKLDDAETVFKQLSSDNRIPEPVRASAMYNLITIAEQRGQDEDVQKYCEQYLNQFPTGEFTPHVRLLQAEALVRKGETEPAQELLLQVRDALLLPGTQAEPWHGRVWVVLAETYLRDKRYTKVRDLADEMLQRPELADFYYQMYEVVGRSWLQQAPPDFDKAREAFARVIGDKNGRRTPTAARSQLLIGDTWVNQDQHAKALPEYQKVYYNYAGQPRLQAAGLFQAAACEEALGQTADALQSYKTLVDEFPASEYAERARARIRELNPAGEARPR